MTELPSPRGYCFQALSTSWWAPRPTEPLGQPAPSAHRMVQEQCCHSQLEELHCATGINLANEQDGCTMPHGDNTSLEAMFVKVRTCAPPSSAATASAGGLGRSPLCTPDLRCLSYEQCIVLDSGREEGHSSLPTSSSLFSKPWTTPRALSDTGETGMERPSLALKTASPGASNRNVEVRAGVIWAQAHLKPLLNSDRHSPPHPGGPPASLLS